MIIQKLYRQFVVLVTKWEVNKKIDEFLIARLRLTFYYSITAIVILGGSSVMLYNTILSNLTKSIIESKLDPYISKIIIDKAHDILLNRFITIDLIIIFFVVILGFLLTQKTLEPIQLNMKRQKRFIADASHELRTPIAVVISGLEVNLNNKELDFAKAKKTLEETLEEMREFSKLSNDLLNLSKYDFSIKKELELLNINDLLISVIEKNKKLAQLKEINIKEKLESNVYILGNKIELSRVFFNVLDNAIKYTKHNGAISITDKIISNKYYVTISDTGCGIPSNILNKVFDPFFRGDPSRSTEGAGLGLTLSKKIIENHKGSILIKSQVNKGTNVIISLPISS